MNQGRLRVMAVMVVNIEAESGLHVAVRDVEACT